MFGENVHTLAVKNVGCSLGLVEVYDFCCNSKKHSCEEKKESKFF